MNYQVFIDRYADLKALQAPDWVKRGAYLHLLRHISFNATMDSRDGKIGQEDLLEAQRVLRLFDIDLNLLLIEDFLRDLIVGISHVDDILRIRGLATKWQEAGEHQAWYEQNEGADVL